MLHLIGRQWMSALHAQKAPGVLRPLSTVVFMIPAIFQITQAVIRELHTRDSCC